jgi:hypothetical protein
MGWFGPKSQLDYALGLAGADRDGDGNFLISGGVFVGIGGEEVAVEDDASFFVEGTRRSMAALLNSTSYGTRNVTVISRETR